MKNRMKTQIITEISMLVAIAVVLDAIAGLYSPFKYGGSISPAMLPIFIIAYRRGIKNGILAGFVFGVIQSLVAEMLGYGVFAFIIDEGWYKFILMYLLDYIIPFSVLGLAAIFKNPLENKFHFVIGIVFASFLRYLSHSISGMLIWSSYADMAGLNHWLYSFIIYNLPYMAASTLFCVVVGLLLFDRNIFQIHS